MAKSARVACPNCAGVLQSHPKRNGSFCQGCGSFFEANMLPKKESRKEISPKKSEKDFLRMEFLKRVKLCTCGECGQKVLFDSQNPPLLQCFRCGGALPEGKTLGSVELPSKVLPFAIDREKAIAIFLEWTRAKRYLPKSFTDSSRFMAMQALYLPFWMADTTVQGSMEAVCTTKRSYSDLEYDYVEKKVYHCIRQADLSLEGIPVEVAARLDPRYIESIEPFDYSVAREFTFADLEGKLMDRGKLDRSQAFPRMKNRAITMADQMLRASLGQYDSKRVTNADIEVTATKWHYVLLPIWIVGYPYKDKEYFFVINGQSGKCAGETPLHKGKLLAHCLGIVAIFAILGLIGGVLQLCF